MLRFHRLLMGPLTCAALIVAPTRIASAQGTAAPDRARLVAHNGVRFSQSSEGIEIRAGQGSLRTDRFYVDVLLRFEFQLVDGDTEAAVFVRSLFPSISKPPELGYRIHLSNNVKGDHALGRVTSWNRRYSVAPMSAVTLAGDWQTCEIRIVGSTLAVQINGTETTETADLNQFVGYLGFDVGLGRLRVRGVQVETLPLATAQFPGTAVRLREGIQYPTVVKDVRPVYSLDAMRNGIEGTVLLEIVVQEDGTVGEVKVVKPIHPDLDASALAAAKQWLFRPATIQGQPLAVVVDLSLAFRIMN